MGLPASISVGLLMQRPGTTASSGGVVWCRLPWLCFLGPIADFFAFFMLVKNMPCYVDTAIYGGLVGAMHKFRILVALPPPVLNGGSKWLILEEIIFGWNKLEIELHGFPAYGLQNFLEYCTKYQHYLPEFPSRDISVWPPLRVRDGALLICLFSCFF